MKGMESMLASMLGIDPAALKAQAEATVKFIVNKQVQIEALMMEQQKSIARIESMLKALVEQIDPDMPEAMTVQHQLTSDGHDGNA